MHIGSRVLYATKWHRIFIHMIIFGSKLWSIMYPIYDLLIFYQTWSIIIRTLLSHNVYQLINNISYQYHKPSHLFSLIVIAKCKLLIQCILKSAQLYAIMWILFHRITILNMIIILITTSIIQNRLKWIVI
jgi:hypothetical protein